MDATATDIVLTRKNVLMDNAKAAQIKMNMWIENLKKCLNTKNETMKRVFPDNFNSENMFQSELNCITYIAKEFDRYNEAMMSLVNGAKEIETSEIRQYLRREMKRCAENFNELSDFLKTLTGDMLKEMKNE